MKATHLAFANAYIKSPDHVTAYKAAFPHVSDKVAATKGKLLLKRDDVAKMITEEQAKKNALYDKFREEAIAKMAADDVASEHEIKKTLTNIIRKKGAKLPGSDKTFIPSYPDQIRAAEVLNSMCGYEAPKETNVNFKTVEPISGMEVTPQDEA
ncbi:MAG TPA: hypothetical protein VJY62_02495 [Bacteroidia bacterium]|nr:hypothetical protein [Bacteroidia bacterium]